MLFKKKIVCTEKMNEILSSFDEIPWFACCGVPYDKPSYYPYFREEDPKRVEKLLLHTKNCSGTVCLTNLFKEGICRADTFILQTAGWKFYQNEFMLCVELRKEFSMGRKRELCLFWGHQPVKDGSMTKSCFSQWWMEDFWSVANTYRCMEQYMMAGKAELFGDQGIRAQILECSDPKQIKALGRKVRGFEQKVWDKFKYAIVLNGNWCKFSQNRDLREFLLSTGDSVLVEASPYDAIWGIRLSTSSPEAQDPMKWRGQNLLGFALMEVRDELRRVTQNEILCDRNAVRGNMMELFAKRLTWELDNDEGLTCLFFEWEEGYFTLSRKTGAETLRLEMNDPSNGQLIAPDCFEYALDNTGFRLNIERNNSKVLRYLEEHHINTELYGEIVLYYTPLSKPQLERLSAVVLRLFFGELLF